MQALDFSIPDSEIVEAEAGDENVLIRVEAGGAIRGRISIEADINPRDFYICLSSREYSVLKEQNVDADGTFIFEGCKPGLYNLYAYLDDRWVGYYHGAVAALGQATDEVLIPMEPAAELVLRFKGLEDYCWYCIEYKGYSIIDDVTGGDRSEKKIVPPGWLRVVLYESAGQEEPIKEEIASKEVFVEAGERREVIFENIDKRH